MIRIKISTVNKLSYNKLSELIKKNKVNWPFIAVMALLTNIGISASTMAFRYQCQMIYVR